MRISDWSSDVCSSDLKVRLILTYPPSTGRNFAEVIRAIDSLQLTDVQSVATPVNWEQGEEVIISPKLSAEDAHAHFPQGFRTLKPYLRSVDLNQSAHRKSVAEGKSVSVGVDLGGGRLHKKK